MYYLAGTTFSLVFDFPLATLTGFGLVLVVVVVEVASCEALRRMVVVVLGGSMGTVGA